MTELMQSKNFLSRINCWIFLFFDEKTGKSQNFKLKNNQEKAA